MSNVMKTIIDFFGFNLYFAFRRIGRGGGESENPLLRYSIFIKILPIPKLRQIGVACAHRAAGEALLGGDDLHGGGLAGAVVAQQAEHLAALHCQRQPRQRRAPRRARARAPRRRARRAQLVLLAQVLKS